MIGRSLLSFTLLALTLTTVGCQTEGPTTVELAAGDYGSTFDAAVNELRLADFPLERIDAARGVIATGPKRTAGMLTPWHGEQQSIGQEWQDLINDQARSVRVTFAPVEDAEEVDDLRMSIAPLAMSVESVIWRYAVPGVRLETEAVGLSTLTSDRLLAEGGAYGRAAAPLRLDEPHAAALTGRILARADRRPAERDTSEN
ncbi:MAG: hypothetical protein CMJ31_07770 [Phycisphaerae bacterium]|nr:hypothetical protein [Phycisphaerae bacterium]